MPRRGENIHKRKDGRWEGRVIKSHENGKAKYISFYGKTYYEVKKKMNSYVIEDKAENNKPKESELQLKDLLYLWLNNIEISHKISTQNKYKHLVETHIIPYIGTLSTNEISNIRLNYFIANQYKNGRLDGTGGLSPSYIHTICHIISSAILFGVKNGYCSPLQDKIVRPNIRQNKLIILSKDEQSILDSYLFQNANNRCLGILLSLYMGLRLGEVCGLMWSDIDLNKKTLQIQRTVERIRISNSGDKNKTSLVLTEPKSETSYRVLPIPDRLVTLIKQTHNHTSKYVVPGISHPYMDPRTYQYYFKTTLKKCNIASINFHALRHTFASRCVESGMDIKSLSEILGHSSTNITLNIYVHSSFEQKQLQINRMVYNCGQN